MSPLEYPRCALLLVNVFAAFVVDDVSAKVECITQPIIPLHGKLTLSGQFIVRLTCGKLQPRLDLPATAPGDMGILFCRPGSHNLQLTKKIEVPECLSKVEPLALGSNITYIYKVDSPYDCTQAMNTFKKEVTTDLTKNWSTTDVQSSQACNKPKYNEEGIIRLMVRFFYRYYKDETFEEYKRKQQADSTILESRHQQLKQWSMGHFVKSEPHPLTSLCDSKRYGVGTIPEVHGVASCRGCPRSWYMNTMTGKCIQCPFDYYTKSDFSGPYSCIPCLDENHWGRHRAEFLKMCYLRV